MQSPDADGPALGVRARILYRPVVRRALVPAALALSLARAARADVSDLNFTYQAPEGCPTAAEFVAEVNRRREARPRENEPRSFHVLLARLDDEASGVLRVRAYGAETSARHVQAKTCQDVAVALALVTALTLDAPPPPPPEEPIHAPPRPVPRRDKEPPDALGMNTEAAARSWWGVGFHLDALVGALPTTAAAPQLFVDARLERSGIWTPSMRLSAARAQTVTNNLELIWTAGRLDVCPTSIPLSEDAALWPCPAFEAGSIDARSELLPPGRPRLWLALGAIARLQWILVHVVLLDIEGGVSVPLAKKPLLSSTGETAHRVAPVAAHAGIGLGGRFP